MLTVPANMQPTLNRWKETLSLGEGMRFTNHGKGTQYAELMDEVVRGDNGPRDANPQAGLMVAKDDGETIRFQGDSRNGSLEGVLADGRVVALQFTETSVDHLQLTPKGDGVEALHEHFDRTTGKGWMQLGGAVTVINMDEPGALDQIFAPQAPSAGDKNAAIANQLGQQLAGKLEVGADQVQVVGMDARKGFNASNCGFPVQGELQMSAWTEGLEVKFACDGQNYVYRGLDDKNGRFGQDVAHQGFWVANEKGVYRPDPNAPKEDDLW